MDAVAFMEATKHPQPAAAAANPAPPPTKRPLLSANASLVAGVATLVLAIGVGVLIGRSGDNGSSEAAQSPQIIRVGGSGGGEEEATTANTGGAKGGGGGESKNAGAGKSKGNATAKKAEKKTKTESNGATAAVNEVYKSEEKLAKPTQKVGESCEKDAAGCNEKTGKFDGSFFGE